MSSAAICGALGPMEGESCSWHAERASRHKVGEEILFDDPAPERHPLTAYVCCECFVRLMGSAAPCDREALTGEGLPLTSLRDLKESARQEFEAGAPWTAEASAVAGFSAGWDAAISAWGLATGLSIKRGASRAARSRPGRPKSESK